MLKIGWRVIIFLLGKGMFGLVGEYKYLGVYSTDIMCKTLYIIIDYLCFANKNSLTHPIFVLKAGQFKF